MLEGGFPNRLSTHGDEDRGMAGKFLAAMLSGNHKDDEEWAAAWESLFGHPIAWEYGAINWRASVVSGYARPGRMIDQAMSGRTFFKYRHLDEWEIMREMQAWGFDNKLVLGHSHEVRDWRFSDDGPSYANSGAAGRFARLIWALEFDGSTVTVVGWFADQDDKIHRYRFEVRNSHMNSWFDSVRTRVTV
jgi:hypothetical protein